MTTKADKDVHGRSLRGFDTWAEYAAEEPPAEVTNRLLAELINTLDDINHKLGDTNE